MADKPQGKVTRVEFELMLDQMLEGLPVLIQKAGADAQLLKAKYDALVKEGFTNEQALEIVKARPLWE